MFDAWVKKFLIVGLFLFLLTSRFILIDRIPSSMAHDEIIYTLTAQVLSETGTDLSGTWKPWSFSPFHQAFAELPAIFMAPAFIIFNNNIFAGRFIHSLISIMFPFVLGWAAVGIFKDKKVFWFTVFLGSINPWFWQFGRMSFDPYLSLFFIILATAIWLNFNNWKKLVAIPFFIIAFFMYQGTKIVLLPWVVILGLYSVIEESSKLHHFNIKYLSKIIRNKTTIVSFILVASMSILLVWYMLFALPNQSANTRLSDIVLLNTNYQSSEVNTIRRMTLDNPFIKIASNKISFLWHHFINRYAKTFNPELLFVNGETSVNAFSVSTHGFFYIVDLILLIIGFSKLIFLNLKNDKRLLFLIGALLLVAPLPGLVVSEGHSYTFRSSLVFAMLLIVASYGLKFLWENYGFLSKYLLSAVYLISITIFAYHYFFRYPLTSLDELFYEERLLTEYIQRIPKDSVVKIHTSEFKPYLNSYLFYTNSVTPDIHNQVRIGDNTARFQNVTFTNSCVNLHDMSDNEIVIWNTIQIEECKNNQDHADSFQKFDPNQKQSIGIVRVKDSGMFIKIFNDKLCNNYNLSSYIRPDSLSDFNFPNLNNQNFCETWFVNQK